MNSEREYENDLSDFGRSRRKFIKSSAVTLGAIGAAAVGVKLIDPIQKSSPPPTVPQAPPDLRGIIPNCHHLPYVEDRAIQDRLIKNINTSGAICTRVFLDDKFEPRLGEYKQDAIDKVAKLSRRMPLVIDLFDAYSALHASKPSSPYLVEKLGRDLNEKQIAIFTDPELRRALISRLRVVVRSLKGESGIKAWGVANELNLRINDIAPMRDLHTDLYQQLIEEILAVDNSRPIFIGIDDPNLIIEERFTHYRTQIINTIHVYPYSSHLKMVYDYRSKEEHFLSLAGQEIGYPKAYRDVGGSVVVTPDYDRTLSQFSMNVFNGLSKHDLEEGSIPVISTWGPWRISAEGDPHNDGFEIIPEKMPETLDTLRSIKESLVEA